MTRSRNIAFAGGARRRPAMRSWLPWLVLACVVTMGGELRAKVERLREGAAPTQALPPSGRRPPTLLAGFRQVGADLLWLRAYLAWQRSDADATQGLLTLVTATDPETLAFWLNGARMIAFDVPAWRLRTLDGAPPPRAVCERVREEQAALALRHLRRAQIYHGHRAALWIEEANVHLFARGDPLAASTAYAQAMRQADAPAYVGRVHAELLRRTNRPKEAYASLVALHARIQTLTHPLERELAMPDVVLARIRELEAELRIGSEERYHPSTAASATDTL